MNRASRRGPPGLMKRWGWTGCVFIEDYPPLVPPPIGGNRPDFVARFFPPLRRGGQGGWSRRNQLQSVQRGFFHPPRRDSWKRSRNPTKRLENKGETGFEIVADPGCKGGGKAFTVSEACVPTPAGYPPLPLATLRSLSTPPGPPFARGGKDRSLAPLFDRAQQKHASRIRPSSTVNTNFSSPHPRHGEPNARAMV